MAHLNTLLVALKELGARVPGGVPLEELLSKPPVKALIILALHVSASLPYAVHGGDSGGALMSSFLCKSLGLRKHGTEAEWRRNVGAGWAAGPSGLGGRAPGLHFQGRASGKGWEAGVSAAR